MEYNTLKRRSNTNMFDNIKSETLHHIISYISQMENCLTIVKINKKFSKIIQKILKKDGKITICLKELKSHIKQLDTFKYMLQNHCSVLEESLVKIKSSFTTFTFYRSIYFLSSVIFKELQSLDLHKLNMGADGVLLLVSLIKNSSVLQYLNISYNNIGDEGCQHLALPINSNNSLQILSLECNAITDIGLKYLSWPLIRNKSLKIIKLALNHVSFEGIKDLADIIDKNISLVKFQVIDFKYNNVVINDESYIKYFRQCKITN
jgi:hypothetical protein